MVTTLTEVRHGDLEIKETKIQWHSEFVGDELRSGKEEGMSDIRKGVQSC